MGYAIETHFQSLAYEIYQGANLKSKPWKNHDLQGMYTVLKSEGHLDGIIVSSDFIKYASYNFKRYPGQVVPAKEEMFESYGGMVYATTMIHYYDDFISQLDHKILEKCRDPESSLFIRALKDPQNLENLALLGENKAIQKRLELFMSLINELASDTYDRISSILEADLDLETLDFSVTEAKGIKFPDHIKELLGKFKPEDFKLPTEKGKWHI